MKDKFQNIELSILFTNLYKSLIFINGFNLMLNISSHNILLSLVLSFLIGFFIIKIFITINNYLPDKNIFEKIKTIYKNLFSNILLFLLIITIFIYTCFSFKVFVSFIKYNYANTIRIEIIALSLLLTILYFIKKDIKTITKTSIISIIIITILDIISMLLSLPNINTRNLLPLIDNSFFNTIKSSYIYIIETITPIFLLLIIPKSNIKNNKDFNKKIKLTYILLSIYTIFEFILTLSIIDTNLLKILLYPNVFVYSKINILNFFDRLENFISYKYMIDLIISIAFSIKYIDKGIKEIYKNNKIIIYIILLLILIISLTNIITNSIFFIALSIYLICHVVISLNLIANIFKKNFKS